MALTVVVTFASSVTLAQAAPFVYVANGGPLNSANPEPQTLSQYGVGAYGLLAPLDPPTVAVSGSPIGLAVSPDARSVYVVDYLCNEPGAPPRSCISQYDIGAGGALTPKTPAALPADFPASAVAVSPDGRSVYVSAGQRVFQFDVGGGGVLSPKSPASVAAAAGTDGLAVSPDGRSVYVATCCQALHTLGAISQYDVGTGGVLSPKSPAMVPDGFLPDSVAVSPDGGSVYVTDPLGIVVQFDVGADGALSSKDPAFVLAHGGSAGVAVSPDGGSVYVANSYSDDVSQYDIGAGGRLSPKTTPFVAAGDAPVAVAVSPDGRSVYVTNSASDNHSASDNLSQYHVGAGGALSPANPPTVATGDNPNGVAVSPAPPVPTTLRECRNGGWKQFGFKSQGRCVAFVVLTRICDALERHGIHLKFCPPTPPDLPRPD